MYNKPYSIPLFIILLFILGLHFLTDVGDQAGRAAGNRFDKPSLCTAARESCESKVFLPLLSRTPVLDLRVNRVEIIQGSTMSEEYTIQIANRPALVRVFIELTGATARLDVTARLTRYVAGAAKDSLMTPPFAIQAAMHEGSLSGTANFDLPAHWLLPGTAYVVEIDPTNSIPEKNENNNRFPTSGTQSFAFTDTPALDIMLVPIDYQPNGTGPHYLPETNSLDYLAWLPIRLFPVSKINYTWHKPIAHTQPVLADGTGWVALLERIMTLHTLEGNPKTHYYGVINVYSGGGYAGGGVVGMALIGAPDGVGFSGFGSGESTAGETLAHELGHNFRRYHSPGCGAAYTDQGYPANYIVNGRASIGQYGYDVFSKVLVSPESNYDFMSYCNPTWTSDYTYKAIDDFRRSQAGSTDHTLTPSDNLYIGGSLSGEGMVHLLPLYRQTGSAADTSAGTHQLLLLDRQGARLAEHHFTPIPMVDGPVDLWGFSLQVPYVEGIAALELFSPEGGQLYRQDLPVALKSETLHLAPLSITVLPDNQMDVTWTEPARSRAIYRVRFSADGGQNWMVLALEARGNRFSIPTDLLVNSWQPVIEVQAVDGLRTATQMIALPAFKQ